MADERLDTVQQAVQVARQLVGLPADDPKSRDKLIKSIERKNRLAKRRKEKRADAKKSSV